MARAIKNKLWELAAMRCLALCSEYAYAPGESIRIVQEALSQSRQVWEIVLCRCYLCRCYLCRYCVVMLCYVLLATARLCLVSAAYHTFVC